MELSRRQFVKALVFTAAAVSGAAWWIFSRTAPERWVEAARGKFYPGPIRPLDRAAIKRIAPWAG